MIGVTVQVPRIVLTYSNGFSVVFHPERLEPFVALSSARCSLPAELACRKIAEAIDPFEVSL